MDLKEAVHITVDDESPKNTFKEIVYDLNTVESGEVSVQTELIRGYLEAIQIETTQINAIHIFTNSGLIVYEKQGLSGVQYLPIRVDTVANNGDKFNFTQTRYLLNESVNIKIFAGLNVSCKITLKYVDL